jgi:hypothetical protein
MEKLFENHSEYLNDIADVDYTLYNKNVIKNGFSDFTEVFCDNLILQCATHALIMKTKDQIAYFAAILKSIFLLRFTKKQFSLKYLTSGICKDFDTCLSQKMHDSRQKQLNISDYKSAYISFKVSFRDIEFGTVICGLKQVISDLTMYCISMHDIDITVDCAFISTRDIIKQYIFQNMQGISLVNDRYSVGDNCISWLSMASAKIHSRTKIYNKFCQMLESTDVRSKFGNQISNLVANSSKAFSSKLQRYKATGMSRIEITLYTNELYDVECYTWLMEKTLKSLSNLATFEVSFDNQWKALLGKITQSCFVYDRKKHCFGYCHWWNSLTSNMNGVIRKNVAEKEVSILIANYSFNDRNSYYLLCDNGMIIDRKIFRRVDGSTALTFTSGSENSLYPSSSKCVNYVPFSTVGLVPCSNIIIGWPEQEVQKNKTKQICSIYLVTHNSENDINSDDLVPLATISHRNFITDYNILAVNETYLVKAYCFQQYRNKMVGYIITSSKEHVRCGTNLTNILQQHLESSKTTFKFTPTKFSKVHGNRSLHCKKL